MVENQDTRQRPMPDIGYRLMASVWLKNPVRRIFEKPESILGQLGINKDSCILDYGCGSGLFSIPAARLAAEGKVFALDTQALAISDVEKEKAQHGLYNIQTILSNSNSIPLPSDSIDLIILSRVIRYIKNRTQALAEMSRVIKLGGLIWVQQGNMSGRTIKKTVTKEVSFAYEGKVGMGYKFIKIAV